MALPDWITPIEGKPNHFAVDPDLFYPAILAEMGVDDPTHHDLELAFGIMKLDFDMQMRMNRAAVPGRVVRIVRSDDGRKLRWNKTMFPKGDVDWDALPVSERGRRIRETYRRLRGFVPG